MGIYLKVWKLFLKIKENGVSFLLYGFKKSSDELERRIHHESI